MRIINAGLLLTAALTLASMSHLALAQTAGLSIVAAENVYGDIARQLAPPDARITSILSNPDEDPHLFEASPSVARSLSAASLVIFNGGGYDPWMQTLLAAAGSAHRRVIVAADVLHSPAGGNPHLWYDPQAMLAFAHRLSDLLAAADPSHKAEYGVRLQRFDDAFAPLLNRVAAMRAKYAGIPVTATEPVFGYMASALGLVMRNEPFQLAVMNNTEPAVSDVIAFDNDLREHRVRVLIYNSQATDTAAKRLLGLAHDAKVPVVGVTETEPGGQTYVAWMLGQLDSLDKALSAAP